MLAVVTLVVHAEWVVQGQWFRGVSALLKWTLSEVFGWKVSSALCDVSADKIRPSADIYSVWAATCCPLDRLLLEKYTCTTSRGLFSPQTAASVTPAESLNGCCTFIHTWCQQVTSCWSAHQEDPGIEPPTLWSVDDNERATWIFKSSNTTVCLLLIL